MNQISKILFALFIVMLSFTPLLRAEDMPKPPPDTSSSELNQIKSLAGRWSSTTSMFGKPNETVYTEFEVTAGGSAVLEKIFPGTPQEMISVYYDDDNGKLAMTHYCIMRNRPTLKLASSKGDTFTMDVAKVEGIKSKDDPSMGAITLRFKDKDHFETTCQGRGKGTEKQGPMTMTYTRVPQK